jgi:hypothetical protein
MYSPHIWTLVLSAIPAIKKKQIYIKNKSWTVGILRLKYGKHKVGYLWSKLFSVKTAKHIIILIQLIFDIITISFCLQYQTYILHA